MSDRDEQIAALALEMLAARLMQEWDDAPEPLWLFVARKLEAARAEERERAKKYWADYVAEQDRRIAHAIRVGSPAPAEPVGWPAFRCGICGEQPCNGHGHHPVPVGEV